MTIRRWRWPARPPIGWFRTKPYRRFSPQRQAERFDPDGEYLTRWRH